MNNFWLACKFWLVCCLIAAVWIPTNRDPSNGWFVSLLGDTAFYAGRSLRMVYDYTLGSGGIGSYF